MLCPDGYINLSGSDAGLREQTQKLHNEMRANVRYHPYFRVMNRGAALHHSYRSSLTIERNEH